MPQDLQEASGILTADMVLIQLRAMLRVMAAQGVIASLVVLDVLVAAVGRVVWMENQQMVLVPVVAREAGHIQLRVEMAAQAAQARPVW
uniref:hypothetical protein n=1 Tax=Atlantibacter hermannii TaxID=565 RepID=UPI0028ACE1C8|nr:hypothetical protein [Atlantibacter hermannii]